jgi:hypothetical protein
MKDVAATVRVADGRDVFRPRLAELGARWRRYGALALHDIDFPEFFLLQRMLTKTRQLQNIAKVIGLCRVKKYIQPSVGLLESAFLHDL